MLWVPTVPHLYFWLLTAPMAGWDICNMMCLAGGLEQAIVDADAAMPPEGLPVAIERAGGESRRLGLKRKALLDLPLKILRCSLRALHQHATLQIFSLRSGT
jgi:hypothetical protein